MIPNTPNGKRQEAGALRRKAEQHLADAKALEQMANEQETGPEAVKAAAEAALDYLLTAQSEDFARGSDREVREALALALGRDIG